MAKGLNGVAFKSGPNKDKHKSAVCAGLNSTGPNKGRLKKGFKWLSGRGCPVPVAGATAAPKKKAKKAAPKNSTKSKTCSGLHASGKKKGKLKKGFKWKSGSKCPVAAKSK